MKGIRGYFVGLIFIIIPLCLFIFLECPYLGATKQYIVSYDMTIARDLQNKIGNYLDKNLVGVPLSLFDTVHFHKTFPLIKVIVLYHWFPDVSYVIRQLCNSIKKVLFDQGAFKQKGQCWIADTRFTNQIVVFSQKVRGEL